MFKYIKSAEEDRISKLSNYSNVSSSCRIKASDNWGDPAAYHTISELSNEIDSVDSKYKEVRLTDDEFEDMYRLGYTLGTSTHSAFTYATISDYDQYKSGKDVNGNPITRDRNGNIMKVVKSAYSTVSSNYSDVTYRDYNGIMGDPGATWTVNELKAYWKSNHNSDPVLNEYESMQSWLDDTISQMSVAKNEEDIYGSITSSNYFEDVATEVHDILQMDYEIDCSIEGHNLIVTFYDSGYQYVQPTADIKVTSDPRDAAQFIAHEAELGYQDDMDNQEDEFTEIASKSVMDSDGFLTEYTMYRDTASGQYVFVFGDRDYYRPEDGDFDWSCDSEAEAWEWFNSYGEDDDESEYDF